MRLVDYSPGMDYGVGVDAVSGEIKGEAVVRGSPEEVTGASGQQVTVRVDRIESSEELSESLNISAELDVSYGLFGGNAKFDFAQETHMNSYSLYFMVAVCVHNSFRQLRDVTLRDPARALLEQGKVDRFRQQFGDTFVRGIATGGEFYGLIRIDTKSESEREKIKASLDASYSTLGSFKGSFEKTVASAAEQKQLTIRTFQRGGADTSIPNTAEQMFERASQFGASVAGDKSVPYAALLIGYDTLDLPVGPNLIDIQNAREVMAAISRQRSMLFGLINDIDYVVLNADQFVFNAGQRTEQLKTLQTQRESLRRTLDAITQAASHCASDITKCAIPELQAEVPDVVLPKRQDAAEIPPVQTGAGDDRILGRMLRPPLGAIKLNAALAAAAKKTPSGRGSAAVDSMKGVMANVKNPFAHV